VNEVGIKLYLFQNFLCYCEHASKELKPLHIYQRTALQAKEVCGTTNGRVTVLKTL